MNSRPCQPSLVLIVVATWPQGHRYHPSIMVPSSLQEETFGPGIFLAFLFNNSFPPTSRCQLSTKSCREVFPLQSDTPITPNDRVPISGYPPPPPFGDQDPSWFTFFVATLTVLHKWYPTLMKRSKAHDIGSRGKPTFFLLRTPLQTTLSVSLLELFFLLIWSRFFIENLWSSS